LHQGGCLLYGNLIGERLPLLAMIPVTIPQKTLVAAKQKTP
jgi:hypothetical protein